LALLGRAARRVERWLVRYFRDHDPRLRYALWPLLVLAFVLYTRHPGTNYIFDEQEALLANPYVNGKQDLAFLDAIKRDFWGLPHTGSIGSYRPLPNYLWRATWSLSQHPFFHHLYNIALHALNGALLAAFVSAWTRRRMLSWLVGVVFVCAAILTEAVSGIVGLADVLGGLGAILALTALRLPAWGMPALVFVGTTIGLFSKESAMVCVPLIPVAALLTAPLLHPERPARVPRALLAFIAAAGAFVAYVELRKVWFPSALPAALEEPLPIDASDLTILYRELLVWFHQAPLPKDPLNNPLVEAHFPYRVAGALRVYWRGLTQVVVPLRLSGDYSFPQEPVPGKVGLGLLAPFSPKNPWAQEPVPDSLFSWEIVAGGLMMTMPLVAALGLYITTLWREHKVSRALDRAARDGAPGVWPMLELPRRDVELVVRRTRRPFRRRFLETAVVLAMAGISGLVTEIVLVSRGAPPYVATWPYTAALVVLACGFVIEGWRGPEPTMGPCRVPDVAVPWTLVGPLVVALGMVWMVVSYFPHSNIPVLLPTVRAERFWYFPVIGSTLVIAALLERIARALRGRALLGLPLAPLTVGAFLVLQSMQAYDHAMDYRDDLAFWRATKEAVPRSSKAHLNYSVMVGARNDLEARLHDSRIAMALAPSWPMAHVYTGDTLCRMNRPDDAWPHYERGFQLGENERSLIALALQCLYDKGALTKHDKRLRQLAAEHPGSWLAHLAVDTLDNHEANKGVNPEHRPRGYNEGPKD
jgi:hypothetical protein